MNYIQIPGSITKLYEGDVVTIETYPGTKWVVQHGWYIYRGLQKNGWYFCSVDTQTTLPATNDVLLNVSDVSESSGCCKPDTSCTCHCPPPPGPPPPCPCPPCPPRPIDPHSFQVEHAFITVDTEAERDYLLANQLIPNGKIVKVNQTTSGTKYFTWNQVASKWEEETFGITPDKYVTTESLPDKVDKIIESSEKVHEVIKEVSAETVQWSKLEVRSEIS